MNLCSVIPARGGEKKIYKHRQTSGTLYDRSPRYRVSREVLRFGVFSPGAFPTYIPYFLTGLTSAQTLGYYCRYCRAYWPSIIIWAHRVRWEVIGTSWTAALFFFLIGLNDLWYSGTFSNTHIILHRPSKINHVSNEGAYTMRRFTAFHASLQKNQHVDLQLFFRFLLLCFLLKTPKFLFLMNSDNNNKMKFKSCAQSVSGLIASSHHIIYCINQNPNSFSD